MLDCALGPMLSLPACYLFQAVNSNSLAPNLQGFWRDISLRYIFLLTNVKLTHSYDRFPLDSGHFLTYRLTGGDTSALRTGSCPFSVVKNSSS